MVTTLYSPTSTEKYDNATEVSFEDNRLTFVSGMKIGIFLAFAICSLACHAQAQSPSLSQQVAFCYREADRFVANVNDGTIQTSKMPAERLNQTIEADRGCIKLIKAVPASVWDEEMTPWRYAATLWAAIALAQDGMLDQTAAMLEKCNAKN
jgi:hypothetical protein